MINYILIVFLFVIIAVVLIIVYAMNDKFQLYCQQLSNLLFHGVGFYTNEELVEIERVRIEKKKKEEEFQERRKNLIELFSKLYGQIVAYCILLDGKENEKETNALIYFIDKRQSQTYLKNVLPVLQSNLVLIKSNTEREKVVYYKSIKDTVNESLSYPEKVQLLYLTIEICVADRVLYDVELNFLKHFSHDIELGEKMLFSMLRLYKYKESVFEKRTNSPIKENTILDDLYSIMGLKKTCTNEEVKKAYRKLSLIHHPDKVSHLGKEYQEVAKIKFQKLVNAYDKIKTLRKMR